MLRIFDKNKLNIYYPIFSTSYLAGKASRIDEVQVQRLPQWYVYGYATYMTTYLPGWGPLVIKKAHGLGV